MMMMMIVMMMMMMLMMKMMMLMMKKGLFAHHTVYVEGACTLGCEKATLTYFRVMPPKSSGGWEVSLSGKVSKSSKVW